MGLNMNKLEQEMKIAKEQLRKSKPWRLWLIKLIAGDMPVLLNYQATLPDSQEYAVYNPPLGTMLTRKEAFKKAALVPTWSIW